jgi:hypothetical protein
MGATNDLIEPMAALQHPIGRQPTEAMVLIWISY